MLLIQQHQYIFMEELLLKMKHIEKKICSDLGVNEEDYYVAIIINSTDAQNLTGKLENIYNTTKTLLLEAVEESKQVFDMINVQFQTSGNDTKIIV